jgi:hypothetical protein
MASHIPLRKKIKAKARNDLDVVMVLSLLNFMPMFLTCHLGNLPNRPHLFNE